jgi:hypothetical protein
MTFEGGQVAFVRDGKHYRSLLVGGSLSDAVEGDPEAERIARKARNLEIGGYVFALGGIAPLVGAVAVQANSHPADEHQGTVTALLLSSIACEVVSLSLTLNAVPRFYDAINIYNDNVDRSLLVPGPPPRALRVAPPSAVAAPRPSPPVPAPAPANPGPTAPNSASFPLE